MAVFIMRLFKLSVPLLLVLGITVEAQSPTKYGVGRTPTDAEITAWDISISPTGEELPVGSGTADLGAQLFLEKGCAGCHGTNGTDGIAPRLVKRDVGILIILGIMAEFCQFALHSPQPCGITLTEACH